MYEPNKGLDLAELILGRNNAPTWNSLNLNDYIKDILGRPINISIQYSPPSDFSWLNGYVQGCLEQSIKSHLSAFTNQPADSIPLPFLIRGQAEEPPAVKASESMPEGGPAPESKPIIEEMADTPPPVAEKNSNDSRSDIKMPVPGEQAPPARPQPYDKKSEYSQRSCRHTAW